MKGRDIIARSLRLIGASAPGESIAAAEAVDGLAALNSMLQTWGIEQLMINSITRESFTLTPNVAAYTMGPTGDFDTVRPSAIIRASILFTTPTPTVEVPIRINTVEQWQLILSKSLVSSYATDLYAEMTAPLATINFYPVPQGADTVVLYSEKPLSQIATLDTDLTFPPGYERALVFNLAMELAPEYGKPVPDVVALNASESKAWIKRTNTRPSYLRVDEALLPQGSRFNIIEGDTT